MKRVLVKFLVCVLDKMALSDKCTCPATRKCLTTEMSEMSKHSKDVGKRASSYSQGSKTK